ncbi:MAG: hypothetical protein AB1758_01325 [Candidatus Eremiobacterota bacterium]
MSLAEVLVAGFVFSLLLGVAVLLFRHSTQVWKHASSAEGARHGLSSARAALERDLRLSDPALVARADVPTSLGGGPDGQALWFLSPVDPATGEVVRKQDGYPFWQRNILYYLVVPSNHDAVFGVACAGGADPADGYDDRCPHKVLIRKVIDDGVPTTPADEATEEALIADITPYLTRPVGFSTAGMTGEPGLELKRILGGGFLKFSTRSVTAREIAVDLRSVAFGEAARNLRVGQVSLVQGRYTHRLDFSVLLRN